MKYLFLTLLVLLIGLSVVSAQSRFNPEDQIKELKKELKLDAKQEKAVKAILDDQQKKMKELFDSSSEDRGAMRDKMRAMREESNKKIMDVLTKEQQAQYKNYLDERRKQRQNQGAPGNRKK